MRKSRKAKRASIPIQGGLNMKRLIQLRAPSAEQFITSQYGRFRGVDFGTDPFLVDPTRSPSAVNVISDAGGYPEKRLGWRVLHELNAPINGLYSFVKSNGDTVRVAHCNNKFYTWTTNPLVAAVDLGVTANNAKSTSFVYANKLYILDGTKYWVYDGTTIAEVTGFVPTTSIGNPPAGGGVAFEAVNLLSAQRKNSFVGDGGKAEVCRLQISTVATVAGNVTVTLNGVAVTTAVLTTDTVAGLAIKIGATAYTGWTTAVLGDTVTFTATAVGVKADALYTPGTTGALGNMITLTQGADVVMVYQLDTTGIGSVDAVVVGGVTKTVTTHYTVNLTTGQITFTAGNGPTTPANNVDNVVITFTKTVAGYADKIKKCTIAAWFGMGDAYRLFLSGNPDSPNMDWQSATYNPTYFPDTGYTQIGSSSSRIMGYLRQYDNQLVIKSDNEQDATIYMRTAEIDGEGTIYFPLKQGVSGIGAVSARSFATLNDDPLFLAKEGIHAPSLAYGGVGQQRVTEKRSRFVDAVLTKESNLNTAVATVWNNLYILCVNSHCYVADGRQPRVSKHGYEWFYWTNIPALCFLPLGDDLFFGTADGEVCAFNVGLGSSAFNDDGEAVDAWWATKLDADGDFMRYKTLPLRGSGVLVKPYAHSTASIYVRTEKDIETLANSLALDVFDFGDLDFDNLLLDTAGNSETLSINYPVVKYKALQLIARNKTVNEGFGVYGFIKRFRIGGYVE
jgi:hypothetical protein